MQVCKLIPKPKLPPYSLVLFRVNLSIFSALL